MIKHHIHPEILMAYAAGNTSPSVSLIVASHITLCAECRKTVEDFESLGGKLLENSDTVETNDSSLDNIFDKIDDIESNIELVKPTEKINSFKNIPSVLSNYLPDGKAITDNWKKGIGGIKYFDINLGDFKQDTHARMLSIPPGKKLPHHGHESQELTLVLEGGFKDENGSYNSGDVAIEDENNIHTPVSDPNEGCICLVVYEGRLKFKGFFGPILNILNR